MPTEPVEKPDPDEVRQARVEQRLKSAREEYHSVYADGENMTRADTDASLKRLAGLKPNLVEQFLDIFDALMREAKFRRETWENELTRPSRDEAKDPAFAVHFVLDIDTKAEWVELRKWKRCGGGGQTQPDLTHKPCPEKYWDARRRERNEL